MNELSINQTVKAALELEKQGHHTTMLGIGPMSKTLIKATMRLAEKQDCPLMFIASRNQVDKKELGGGYVNNWDQENFVKDIKKIAEDENFTGLYYICRDHGGPWQRDNERKAEVSEEEAMKLAKESYLEDLIQGFDLLHIDPTKDPSEVGKVIPLETVLNRTVELIEYVESERKTRNLPEVGYEVGTEETNGGLTSNDTYCRFIEELSSRLEEKGLPMPLFIVGQTGTLTRKTENVGNFNLENAKVLADDAKKYGVGLKEHNGDYLPDHILLAHLSSGITAMNVAPEFGTVETQSYLKLIQLEEDLFNIGKIVKQSNLKEVLIKHAILSERWRKWMVGDDKNLTVDEILVNEKISAEIVEICGHYTFNDEAVKNEIEVLFKNLEGANVDGEEFVINSINRSINRYIEDFNLIGLTSKVRDYCNK